MINANPEKFADQPHECDSNGTKDILPPDSRETTPMNDDPNDDIYKNK